MEITTILWMFMFGASAAIISVYYNSRFLGRLVRALIKIDATSPESAMTPEELGIKITPALKNSLRSGTSFSQTVLKTEDGRYYISAEKLDMAKSKYRGKDTSVIFVFICILVLFVVTLALNYILPDMIEGFGQDLTSLFGEGK